MNFLKKGMRIKESCERKKSVKRNDRSVEE
jgi:hypothetical protein